MRKEAKTFDEHSFCLAGGRAYFWHCTFELQWRLTPPPKPKPAAAFQKAGKGAGKNGHLSLPKERSLRCFRRNCSSAVCSCPGFSFWRDQKRQWVPLVRSFEGHTGPGKGSFYNLIAPSSSALPGGYVSCKESQSRKELHYSAAFIYSEYTRLYRLCMNFSHCRNKAQKPKVINVL